MAEQPPLRVLMLITNLGQGGAERVFHDHATAFAECGMVVEQAVFAGDYHDAYKTRLPLHHLQVPFWLAWLGAPGRLLGRALALRRLVTSNGYDVVVSHMDGANWVNALSGSAAAKILVNHGSILHDRNQRGWRQWLRKALIIPLLYNRAEATVAVSEGLREELATLGVRRVEAIPNFFDLAAIRDAARTPVSEAHEAIFAQGPVLVTSGRLAPQKNQSELLHLLADLRERGAQPRLLMLGDGELRGELLATCADLGLKASHPWREEPNLPSVSPVDADVLLVGYQNNPFALIARAHLFLFPSLWEGFPLALCEAMACGVPALSADCHTGPREILAPDGDATPRPLAHAEFPGPGVLLPVPRDVRSREAWLDTVTQLLEAPEQRRRIGDAGRLAVQRLDRGIVLERWRRILERAVEAHGD